MNRRRILCVASCVVLMLLPLLAMRAHAQTYVTTDKPDYRPGETVYMAGTGWEPGETVTLTITTEPVSQDPLILHAAAVGSGDFTNSEFVVPEADVPLWFTLEAQGQSSGYGAEALYGSIPTTGSGPWVTTDHANYSPGQTVLITGEGWLAGEVVSLTITDDPPRRPPTFLNAFVDAEGSFSNSELLIREDDLGVHFTLEATGQTSGSTAQTTFADSPQEPPPVFMTMWGSLGSTPGQFRYPRAVATDAAGSIYVTDEDNNRIQKFMSNGAFLAQWSTSGPGGIATDAAGNVYVTDLTYHRIRKFTSSGTLLTQWGSYDGDAPPGSFYRPGGVAADPAGNVYVADTWFHRIQKFASNGAFLTQWGSQGSGVGQFSYPGGVATDAAGNVYVLDSANHRIQKFTSSGAFLSKWGSYGGGDGQLANAVGIATDASGNVYVADTGNHRIQKFTSSGTFLSKWGSQGSGTGQFQSPRGIAADVAGSIYVSDTYNHRVQLFAYPPSAGGIAGYARAACPNPGTGMPGLSIGAYRDGPGQTFVKGTVTDASGYYRLADLTVGNYWIRIVPPSSFEATANDLPVSVAPGADAAVDIELRDVAPPDPIDAPLPDVVGECSATITAAPSAIDNCAGVIRGTTSDPVEYTAQGTYTVHWQFADGAGNVLLQDQRVIVRDETMPSIQAPPAVPAVAGTGPAGCAALVTDEALGTAVGSDNCSGTVAITRSGVPYGNFFPVGTTTITWTATDAAGNRASATQEVRVTPGPGAVAGRVMADCPTPGTGLAGVRVDVFDSLGTHIGTDVTDAWGGYELVPLASRQPLTVTVVSPLGYRASAEDRAIRIECGETVTLDYTLACVEIVANPRSSGFWKHQVGVATGGPGNAQVDGATLCSYLDLIAEHFNGNAMNPVVVYEPPESGVCEDKVGVAKALLNLRGNVGMASRARQQLVSLLLNVTAGNIAQQQVVSEDGATVSQAITFCDRLIDGPSSGHELAKTIADQINNNLMVASEVIPLDTEHIAYRLGAGGATAYSLGQNLPNPFRGMTTITYALPRAGTVRVTVCDVGGRVIKVLTDGTMGAGQHRVSWDGIDQSGSELAAGVYFYRMEARAADGEGGPQIHQRKMIILR
jgi:sugar lactone lactonase YvrE